jgi:hypothetical protein
MALKTPPKAPIWNLDSLDFGGDFDELNQHFNQSAIVLSRPCL